MKKKIASCFPGPPAGYTAEEVQFEPGFANDLLAYLKQEKGDRAFYEGGQTLSIELTAKGMEAYKFALSGQNPGCEIIEAAGRKAVIMYGQFMAVPAGKRGVCHLFLG